MSTAKIIQSKEWFEKLYLNDHLSCRQIAHLIGDISHVAVYKRLKEFNIPMRSKKDAIFYENGNQCKISQGYFWIYNPDHPRNNYKYVKRSVLVLEEKLGRPLEPHEMVHHLDGDRLNDHPDNLEPTTRSKHMKDHRPIDIKWQQLNGWRKKRINKAIKMWKQGFNTTEIAEELNTSHSRVISYLADIRKNNNGKRRKRKIN